MSAQRPPSLVGVLCHLPVLPADVYPVTLSVDVAAKTDGFIHPDTYERNYLYMYKHRWYRLPESVAVVMLNNTTHFNQ